MLPVRIMSFNINGAIDGGDNSWEKRAPLCLAMFDRYRPDIIGLQECSITNQDLLYKHLNDYEIVPGNCYGDNPPQEYSSILFLKSRFELVDKGEFWFSETPECESADWGVEYPLGATWVKLKSSQTNQQIFHLNTHFEDGPWGEQSRLNATRLIINHQVHLAADLPSVITGDFNCNPWSKPYQIFLENGFIDTFREAGNADSVDSSSFHGYRGKDYFPLNYGDEMFWRVDWILAFDKDHKIRTTSSSIVRDALPPTYPSDHYPIVSEVQIKP